MDGYALEVKGRTCQPLIGICMIKRKLSSMVPLGTIKNLASRVLVLDCATVT